ncbi:hypothetical protein PCANC_06392 [Puccinia coronata f. sp. avenae]|uniref:Zn(2)-C6 fungal-type domain-containing protein n=1 Tax=Puccinia coronata f. sp. avenae TaxID=200324 RepID=A0A2N5VVS6_9BASI|nr:hypothetical protein PCANC_06392 [Puccinia coronata f. sp. avenae]
MISTTLITALLLASAANALESYDTQPQREASYLSPQANYGLKNAPNAVVPASHPVASTGLTQTHTTPSNDNTGDSRDANPSRSSGSHKNGKLAKRQFQQAGPGSEHNAADPRPQDGGMAPTNSSQWGGPAMPAGAQMNNSQPGGPVMPAGAMRVAQTNASQWGGPAMPAGPQMNYSQPGGPVMPAGAVRVAQTNSSQWGGPAMPAGGVPPTNYSQPGGPVMPSGGVRVAQTNSSQSDGPVMPGGVEYQGATGSHNSMASPSGENAQGRSEPQHAAGLQARDAAATPGRQAGGVAQTKYSQPGAPVMAASVEQQGAPRAHTGMASPSAKDSHGQSVHPQHAAGLQARTNKCKIPTRCQSPHCNSPTSCKALHKYCAKKALRCRY